MDFDKKFAHAVGFLIEGRLQYDELLALAEENRESAIRIASGSVGLLPANLGLITGPVKSLFDLVWVLCGPEQSMRTNFAKCHDQKAILGYIRSKLKSEPDAFKDEDLDCIEQTYSIHILVEPLLAIDLRRVRADRLKKEIAARRQIPTDLNTDVQTVRAKISAYSFGDDLNSLLQKVDDEMADDGDPFDQAAILKHLRTFFEKLHEQAGTKLRTERPETVDQTPLGSCGQALDFLRRKDVLTGKMVDLGKALYGVLSNEGVHAIKSEREYVRLCRNMVVEYALALFFELDRRLAKSVT